MRLPTNENWTKKDSVELAIYAAELVIHRYEQMVPTYNAPRRAIEAAKECLRAEGLAETGERGSSSAARAAKRGAFRAGADAGRSAARADVYATRAYARDAKAAADTANETAADWDAARDAAEAASAAGYAAAANNSHDAAAWATACVDSAVSAAGDTDDVSAKCNGWILVRIAERVNPGIVRS